VRTGSEQRESYCGRPLKNGVLAAPEIRAANRAGGAVPLPASRTRPPISPGRTPTKIFDEQTIANRNFSAGSASCRDRSGEPHASAGLSGQNADKEKNFDEQTIATGLSLHPQWLGKGWE
jgi:hypothetical protein